MKIHFRPIYIFSLIILMAFGCGGVKTRFSKTELKWLDVYKEGDTLIYKSQAGELDTSFIIKKEIYYPSYNPVEVHNMYLPLSFHFFLVRMDVALSGAQKSWQRL
jgi:hypothetical protein